VLLDLTLRPNRSLSRDHARWLVLAVGGLFLIGSIRFLVLGLWPVIPFMVADVALLAWALRSNFRSGGNHERLVLAQDQLILTRVSPWGETRVSPSNPGTRRCRSRKRRWATRCCFWPPMVAAW
jgi:hypothetical protein